MNFLSLFLVRNKFDFPLQVYYYIKIEITFDVIKYAHN